MPLVQPLRSSTYVPLLVLFWTCRDLCGDGAATRAAARGKETRFDSHSNDLRQNCSARPKSEKRSVMVACDPPHMKSERSINKTRPRRDPFRLASVFWGGVGLRVQVWFFFAVLFGVPRPRSRPWLAPGRWLGSPESRAQPDSMQVPCLVNGSYRNSFSPPRPCALRYRWKTPARSRACSSAIATLTGSQAQAPCACDCQGRICVSSTPRA